MGYALIPARQGSKGIPGKNTKRFADGTTPLSRAVACAERAGLTRILVSTDDAVLHEWRQIRAGGERWDILRRPAALATDESPMVDVVRHALEAVPGEPEDIWCLLQPTQPLRAPAHVQAAIDLLRSSGADSVVSVVPLPATHHPDVALRIIEDGRLCPFDDVTLEMLPTRRQAIAPPAYIRDGTVYAFRRATVTRWRNIYGLDVRPLVIPASETCALDTPEDWAEAERRLQERDD